MLNDKIKGTILGLLVGSTLTGSIAFARTGSQMIEAVYSDIKLYVDGVKVNTDSNEPFIYNGSTYLPVRAVGEALGQPVDWDGNTKSVYIGERPGSNIYLTDVCPAYEWDYWRYKECTSSNGEYFTSAGQNYTNGFTVDPYNGATVTSLYNLNGKYNSMSFIVGHVDGTASEYIEVKIYADGKIIKNLTVQPDDIPKSYTVDLNGAVQLKIEAVQPNGSWTYNATYGFANVILK